VEEIYGSEAAGGVLRSCDIVTNWREDILYWAGYFSQSRRSFLDSPFFTISCPGVRGKPTQHASDTAASDCRRPLTTSSGSERFDGGEEGDEARDVCCSQGREDFVVVVFKAGIGVENLLLLYE
jgi:hypothetical protein